MLQIEDEILLNKYGQGLIEPKVLLKQFNALDLNKKRDHLLQMTTYILQSKPNNNDIEPAIINANIKATYTPCILLKKNGVLRRSLTQITTLPENELSKVFLLFLNLFKIAYHRRFIMEINNPHKWWYWDLSDENKLAELEKIKQSSLSSQNWN